MHSSAFLRGDVGCRSLQQFFTFFVLPFLHFSFNMCNNFFSSTACPLRTLPFSHQTKNHQHMQRVFANKMQKIQKTIYRVKLPSSLVHLFVMSPFTYPLKRKKCNMMVIKFVQGLVWCISWCHKQRIFLIQFTVLRNHFREKKEKKKKTFHAHDNTKEMKAWTCRFCCVYYIKISSAGSMQMILKYIYVSQDLRERNWQSQSFVLLSTPFLCLVPFSSFQYSSP